MITQHSKDMERILKALDICRNMHDGQVDKCGQPYWIHPFTVGMECFSTIYENTSYIIVGLLHDVPEDTGMPVDALETLIELTEEETDALKLLTRDKNMSYDQYIEQIANSNNMIAVTVKMRDLMHNMDLDRFWEANIDVTAEDEKRAKKYESKLKQLCDANCRL